MKLSIFSSLLLLKLLLLLLLSCSAIAQDLKWLPLQPSYRLHHDYHSSNTFSSSSSSSSSKSGGKNWAVLVAGSNSWYNYRHQADICHAYQILRRNGIAAENIITMMYDDIANNTENPTPGKIVNRPNGTDVYHGVYIDYRGKEVTAENFLKVLKGEGDGKVLRSGANDRVFVNFVDHGAPGLVAFPTGVLKAKQLTEALTYMHEQQMYDQLVFYMEACESGSMFQDLLPSDIHIYATTAANSHESSYACYYDIQRRTFLGDVYSVNWMEDSDSANVRKETLDQQYSEVKLETNQSHVMRFGDQSMGELPIGDFQGNGGSRNSEQMSKSESKSSMLKTDAVSQRVARASILQKRIAAAATDAEKFQLIIQLKNLLQRNAVVNRVFDGIIRNSVKAGSISESKIKFFTETRADLKNFDCHHAVVDEINDKCFDIGKTEEALWHIYKIVNLCEYGIDLNQILKAVMAACPTLRL